MTSNKNILSKLAWISLIMFCLPYVISTRYTVFWTDDFTDARRAAEYGGNMFYNAIKYTDSMYKSFQGTFASIFLQSIFSPLTLNSIALLRIISILNIIIFLVASYIFVKGLLVLFDTPRNYVIFFVAIIIIPLLSYKSYAEILYWYTGQTTYTYPLSCGLIAITSMINLNKQKKSNVILKYVISALLIVYGCGGSLQVSGMVCYISLCISVVMYCQNIDKNKRVLDNIKLFLHSQKEFWVVTAEAIIISVINLLAPGNFVRHDVMEANEGTVKLIIKTTYYSIQLLYKSLIFYFKQTTFVVFFIIAIYLGLRSLKKISVNIGLIGVIAIIGLPFVSLFPVLLGYNYDYSRPYFPTRVQFGLDYSLIICMICCGYIIGGMANSIINESNKQIVVVVLFSFGILHSLSLIKPVEESLPFMVAESIVTEDLRMCSDRIMNAYKSVETSNELDVVVYYPEEAIEWFSVETLSDSPNNWFNQTLAKYYNKNSVAFYREINCD